MTNWLLAEPEKQREADAEDREHRLLADEAWEDRWRDTWFAHGVGEENGE